MHNLKHQANLEPTVASSMLQHLAIQELKTYLCQYARNKISFISNSTVNFYITEVNSFSTFLVILKIS